MNFSLIVCTYHRPAALIRLLDSVAEQTIYPDQILIIDGSTNSETRRILSGSKYSNLEYYLVNDDDRGLTRQRNFGIKKISGATEIICFLDDDIVLTPTYFEDLLNTYFIYPEALGVGGYIIDEVKWEKANETPNGNSHFFIDGLRRSLGSRNILRKRLQLLSDKPPGYMPEFSNGFSTGFLPPTGRIYPVEFFMGGVASYKREVFKKLSFSEYFIGYGLYEDMDFCLRISQFGQLYVNTKAKLYHHHEPDGRPDSYKYGKMVIRNGWYVWRVKYENPSLAARFKWHSIAFVLTIIRLLNVVTTTEKKAAFMESMGRVVGWWSLNWDHPKVQR